MVSFCGFMYPESLPNARCISRMPRDPTMPKTHNRDFSKELENSAQAEYIWLAGSEAEANWTPSAVRRESVTDQANQEGCSVQMKGVGRPEMRTQDPHKLTIAAAVEAVEEETKDDCVAQKKRSHIGAAIKKWIQRGMTMSEKEKERVAETRPYTAYLFCGLECIEYRAGQRQVVN